MSLDLSAAASEAVPTSMVFGAAEAVVALREALTVGDVGRAQAVRWLAPRPPGERDLLSDMAAAQGVVTAVQQLSRFWRGCRVRLERVRAIDPLEAEVYERLELRGEVLPIVSVVRRQTETSPWQVVCTNEATDERYRLWIGARADAIDEAAWLRRGDAPGELLMMDAADGVLGHPERGWLVQLSGPLVPKAWPESIPGAGGRVVELSLALSSRGHERAGQLRWVMRAALALLDQLGGDAAILPGTERLMMPDALYAAGANTLLPRHAFRFWASIEDVGSYVITRGLGRLGLPEVEAPLGVLSRPELTRTVVERFAATLLASPHIPTIGTELVVGEETVVLVAGRRGPRRGASYGRFGAFALAASDPRIRRGSRTRMRIPVD